MENQSKAEEALMSFGHKYKCKVYEAPVERRRGL
jgi:hypothetical protein